MALPFRYRHVPWQLARLGGPREILAWGHALVLGHALGVGVLRGLRPYSTSPPTGKAPDHRGRGLDCPVWVVRPLGPHRFYSTSGNRWLGNLFPAGATALTARDRRGDIVHRDFPISAARTALRGVGLHIRRVGGL